MRICRCMLSLVLTATLYGLAQGQSTELRPKLPYTIVDTGQTHIFDAQGPLLKAPRPDEPLFGQDGFYQIAPPSYTLSRDGRTVDDNQTGLTWQRSPDTNGDGRLDRSDKLTWAQAQKLPAALNAAKYGGYSDWRLPSIKELYSLIDFRGVDPSGFSGADTSGLIPFIDTHYFQFAYGQTNRGERIIDSQYASSTLYVNKTWRGDEKLFGVNFADGRIKGYDLTMPGGREKTFFVQCVRGNPNYGKNDFHDQGDQTILDRATGRMWSRADSGQAVDWAEALAWVQARNRDRYLGHSDWRMPTAKELQSIVDYSRSPDSSRSPAIDPLFACTPITNEAHQADYPCYWTGTTHGAGAGRAAVYVAFGRAIGYMLDGWHDVHGAGAQRSDPKIGDAANFPHGRGPQGDAIRIKNFVRLVRNVNPQAVQLVTPDLRPLPIEGRIANERPVSSGPAGGREGPGGPQGGYHLLPHFAVEPMNLSPAQHQRLVELEREVKAQLDKILTPEQQRILDSARPPGPFGPPPPR